jgi:hypothetical protein
MFVALFTIAKKWISDMCYIHTMEYYSALKRDGNSGTCYIKDEPLQT